MIMILTATERQTGRLTPNQKNWAVNPRNVKRANEFSYY